MILQGLVEVATVPDKPEMVSANVFSGTTVSVVEVGSPSTTDAKKVSRIVM